MHDLSKLLYILRECPAERALSLLSRSDFQWVFGEPTSTDTVTGRSLLQNCKWPEQHTLHTSNWYQVPGTDFKRSELMVASSNDASGTIVELYCYSLSTRFSLQQSSFLFLLVLLKSRRARSSIPSKFELTS